MIWKKPFLKELIFLSILVAVLHQIALVLFLYWIVDWFDILMHFLGGLTIGIAAIYFFYYSGIFKLHTDKLFYVFFVTLGSVLVVGLSWELWEIFVGFTDVLNDQVDTITDIFFDIIGGFTAFLYFKSKSNINE